MNKKIYLFALAVLAGLFSASCDKKDDVTPGPVINILELGKGDSHGNDHTATVGSDLHIEAEIIAEGTIDKVTVRIHPEGEHDEEGEHEEWELDSTYTKFSGLKNTLFHEHVEIDSSALPGQYHFDFIVTDMQGYQTSAESDLQIIKE